MRRVSFLIVATVVAAASLRSNAQQPPPGSTASARPTARTVRGLPGTRADAFATIQGSALNSSDGALSDGVVRLRDARYGRVVDTTRIDKSGTFAFRHVDPGSYIVELVGPDQTVLAASQVLDVNSGDAVAATVKLPYRVPPAGGVGGHAVASALVVTAAAAASGVLATAVAGEDASPRR